MSANADIEHGNKYPFDASDAWWKGEDETLPENFEAWQYRAARGVIANMQDRAGIKHELGGISEDTRREIIESIASIIYAAYEQVMAK